MMTQICSASLVLGLALLAGVYLKQAEENVSAIDADVIVIGAGVSGISAAYVLLQKMQVQLESGKSRAPKIIVLEAQSRLGGRVQAENSNGTIVNVGASWIHHAKSNPIALLARYQILRAGLHVQHVVPLTTVMQISNLYMKNVSDLIPAGSTDAVHMRRSTLTPNSTTRQECV